MLDLGDEAERPRTGQFSAETGWVQRDVEPLTADRRRIEDDLDGHLETLRRNQGRALAGSANLDRRQDLQVATRGRQRRDPSGIDSGGEVRGRPVHDRSLGAVDLDDRVVDPEAGEGGHQVLDRRDTGALGGLATTVANIVALTVSTLAGMRFDASGRSVRTKTTPASAGAGFSVIRTGAPLWTPTPDKVAGAASVV